MKHSNHVSNEFSEGFNMLLAPLIKFSTVVHSIILDGEMLVYDTYQSRYFTKGETPVDVKNIKDKSSKFRPCFCAFDILLYNDESYMNRPYTERCQLLQQLFKDRIGVMVKTKPIRIRDVDHMLDLFNAAVEKQEEGIVLKDAQSIYKPGDRQGGWYKVKADYFDGDVVKEFDCVIIGGFYENLNSRNFIHKYLVGAVEKIDEDCMNVFAVGEVSQGVTAQERIKINESQTTSC
ncbi:CLUMA_CG020852, isoform A [Clunio marinus]|uniref:CLUMA_CG020852, isoform A n=1 Tax=Clunio marinus TaxID=568069 RepID=A0A1J1J9J8_9DIPT|nr:CLUMA_CG020852, isoform A [Clunio marinus]